MTSDTAMNCRQCGRPISPAAPLGCCPVCVVENVLQSAPSAPRSRGANPPASEELAGHFPGLQIVGLLGQGGMGAVYLARQPKLERDVALKILHPDLATDPEFAERFFREARVLAKLNHPNVVAVFDVDQAGPYLYLLMEYVEGATLRDLMQGGRIDPAEALRMVPQICEAIQYAHDRGVVHRDIKPENILLNEEGAVKIADFGLAKLAGPVRDSLTSTRARMGTAHYMAPEQSRSTATVDHRADIYSLGVTFYEMLTGHLPTVDYQPPSSKADVGSAVDRIVGRSLKTMPDERYQQAAEMKVDVERIAFRRGRTSGMAWGVTLSAAVLVVAATCLAVWNRAPDTNKSIADAHVSQAATPSLAQPAVVPASIEIPEFAASAENGTIIGGEQQPSPSPVTAEQVPPIPKIAEFVTGKSTWTHPVNLGPAVNSPSHESQPCLSADGLILYFSSDRSPDGQWTQDLWQCRRSDANAPWGPAEKLPAPVNTPAFESDPCLSGDGLHLAFVSNRPGGAGEADVWISHRDTVESPWGRTENAGPTVNSPADEGLGGLSHDDRELFFSSRRDSAARHGLLVARRDNSHAAFGPAAPLPVVMGKPEVLGNPYLTPDGRIIIWTGRANGEQTPDPLNDLFYSTRADHHAPFVDRMRFDGTVNSIYAEIGAFLSRDGQTLLFESDRPGTIGGGDIWMSQRIPVEELQAQEPHQNYALAFDGESTLVEIPTLTREAQGPVTLEAWVRGEVPASAKVLFAIGGLGRCQINIEPEGWCACDHFLIQTKTAHSLIDDSRVWGHVAYVVDDKVGVLFVDGKEVQRIPKTTESNGTDPFSLSWSWIGGHPGRDGVTSDFHFRGEIDEVRISSVARYAAPFIPERKFTPDADTIALYHFDEGRGDLVPDASGHEHHGTIRLPYWVRLP